ncbi:unnamed protein product [Gongylonema pulchrum]|uniref:CPSF_A domain-containing protein n=1 Tax=Gongylonema pulchrum TaxID=637853 RepID=A0A183DP86_9BILA|nr:unnamed protein product [Gongylonema pulchrum]
MDPWTRRLSDFDFAQCTFVANEDEYRADIMGCSITKITLTVGADVELFNYICGDRETIRNMFGRLRICHLNLVTSSEGSAAAAAAATANARERSPDCKYRQKQQRRQHIT